MDTLHLAGLVAHHARYRPTVPAVMFEDQRLDWRQFHTRCQDLAQAMRAAGAGPGERVATVLGNCLELLELYWACAAAGTVAVPLSPLLQAAGLETLLRDAAPRLIFVSSGTAAQTLVACAAIASSAQVIVIDAAASAGLTSWADFVAAPGLPAPFALPAPDAPYNIMYTSGTTGTPKGILLTHRIRAHYATLMGNAFRVTPDSVILHTGAIVFNGAFVMMMPAFALGAHYILHRQFDARRFVETVEREQVTHTMLVPAQIAAILDLPDLDAGRLASLQVLLSLGAPLPLPRKESLEALLPGRFHELYGLTEGFVTILDRRDAVRKQGSVGIPPPFFELRIVRDDGSEAGVDEIGEIAGRGPYLMPGYYGRPDLTAAAVRDGWLHSGDLGRVDADGYLYLVDRKKDMIDSGGVKVYPRDIEEVIARHPDVAEAVVIGIPDDKWGETPLAFVQLKAGASGPGVGANALRDWINAHVGARYQSVSGVEIVVDFPRNAAGKTLKRALRDPYWEGRESAI
jgi:acyl-CoA synthetase (AMP-forming)/AMP-acid ligase II